MARQSQIVSPKMMETLFPEKEEARRKRIDTGGCITNNVDTVVTLQANQPTQIDHARCDNEVNPESSVQAAYCEGTKGGGNDFVKCCYNKRRRISVNRR
ncbi:hypothetical protein V6Z11_A11G326200 [Gossypium hirsutum]